MSIVQFEERRFQSTAAYYLRYRVPYPDDLIAKVAMRTGLKAGGHVLDLGCGPGQLGIAFARRGARVTALDPEPEMIAAAEAGADHAGVVIDVRKGSSYDLGPAFNGIHLAVMGRSFHWMDRVATLKALDSLIEPGGAVVLFHDRSIWAAPNWRKVIEELAERLSPEKFAERQRRKSDDWEPHEAILLHSPFHHLERISVFRERKLSIDDIVGRAFSMSVTSPQALGENVDEFEAALRNELGKLAPDGQFREISEIAALMAFRKS